MKRGLIITVAGLSTRFNKGEKTAYLKCLYTCGNHKESLLGKLLEFSAEFNKIFIVGGYKFEDLKNYIHEYHSDKNIELIFNKYFDTLGSLESLRLGVEAAEKSDIDELVFAEGDLFFDKKSFIKVIYSDTDVITTNSGPITADKAVALYIKDDNQVRYVYDSLHKSFIINGPFKSIYNSAQVWKFKWTKELYAVNKELTKEECAGPNLLLIERYYGNLKKSPQIIPFIKWFNCNTIADYDLALSEIKGMDI